MGWGTPSKSPTCRVFVGTLSGPGHGGGGGSQPAWEETVTKEPLYRHLNLSGVQAGWPKRAPGRGYRGQERSWWGPQPMQKP